MRHVTIFGYDFESLDGFGIAHNVVKEDWSVLFDPERSSESREPM